MIRRARHCVASLLIVSLAGLGLPLPAQAGMVPTGAAVASVSHERIASALERSDVRAQLRAYGVSPDQVRARVAAMTDAEAAELAANLDSLPAGGSVLGVAVFVFLVLLLTDILGYTKIFPFTRSAR